MLLYGNLANPSSLFAYVKAGATTACVSMYVFWTHACVLIPKTRFPSNHVSKTLYPKTERILQVRACRNFRGSFEHRNCAIVHVHLELRLQHWKIFGYVTTPYPTAYIYIFIRTKHLCCHVNPPFFPGENIYMRAAKTNASYDNKD